MKRTWDQVEEYGQLGIIESISLRNFMCHDNLSFDFDPHMNFIIGQNGSGKSAILTAVMLALGGKSASTGRFTNIKGYIKTGKHSATVAVTLKNCGPEAYKPNEYGSKITVERQFNSDGVSHYKLKSQRGQIISTSKEELKNILTIMDIQVDNPIIILTQEYSKTFLTSKNSNPHKMFQLFYNGTGLARLQEDYNRANQQKEDAEKEVKLKKSALPEMEKELKNYQNRIDRASKVTELTKELVWALAIKFEKERDEKLQILKQHDEKINNYKKKIEQCKSKENEMDQSLTENQTSKRESFDKMNVLRNRLKELTDKRSEINTDIREIKGTSARYEREVNKLTSESNNLENMINEIKLKDQSDVNNDKLKKDAKVNALKEQLAKAMEEAMALDNQKDEFFENMADMNKRMENLSAEVQELKSNLSNIEREKNHLIAGKKDRIDVFGPEMKPLLQDITKAIKTGMFNKPPKGPIGLYLSVKNLEWNFAVQECLKTSLLKTFVCDNHADKDELTKIISKHYAKSPFKPSIITTKFENTVFNVDKYKTKAGHPTVLDMLEIKDPVIANCLIDQKSIENILLISDHDVAVDLMMRRPPQNCRTAYTLTGDELCHSPYRFYSCRNTNQICMLKSVNQEDITRKDLESKMINAELGKRVAAKQELQRELDVAEREKRQLDTQFTNKRIQIKQLQMKIKDEENSYEEPKDVNCLQSDLEKLLNDKEKKESKLAEIQADVKSKEQELKSLEEQITESKRELQLETENYQTLTSQIDELESNKESLSSAYKKLESQLKNSTSTRQECEAEVKKTVAATEAALKTAAAKCPRILTQRSVEEIRRLKEETERTFQKQGNYDQEALKSEYKEKYDNYKLAKAELERQESINQRIGRMIDERLEEFHRICNNNFLCLTCSFITLLRENQFSGYLTVNFEEQTLVIHAKPEKTTSKIRKGKQNLGELSGGERSYVTIALLLALWDRIHMPFRILDEYDVFMDANNRHRSINLLINTASSNKSIQYIFLSPLELPPIPNSAHVKVHKMPPPRR